MPCFARWTPKGAGSYSRPLSCGQCRGCRLERSRQDAVRCMHEAKMWEWNSFITLTYDKENLPPGGTLVPRHLELFWKSLRERITRDGGQTLHSDKPAVDCLTPRQGDARSREESKDFFKFLKKKDAGIGYFACGEYGEKCRACEKKPCECGRKLPGRPHYHACIFNLEFGDKRYWKTERGNKIFKSEELDKIWGKGGTTIGEVNFETAAYVARYVMKKRTGKIAETAYSLVDHHGVVHQLEPEFKRASRNPAIGLTWLNKYMEDVYPEGKIVVNRVEANAPRYYDKKFAEKNPKAWAELAAARQDQARARIEDNTNPRLDAKEAVAEAKISLLKRSAH